MPRAATAIDSTRPASLRVPCHTSTYRASRVYRAVVVPIRLNAALTGRYRIESELGDAGEPPTLRNTRWGATHLIISRPESALGELRIYSCPGRG